MGTTLGCCLKISVQDPNYFTCYPQNGWGVKDILCLTWPLAVLSLVIKELFSEPTHRPCYYPYSYRTISPSASYCDKLQTEYMEALTFATRHNRLFWTKRVMNVWMRTTAWEVFIFNIHSKTNMTVWLPRFNLTSHLYSKCQKQP